MFATRVNRILISTGVAVFLLIGCKGHGSSSSIPQSLTNWIWEDGTNAAGGLGYYAPLGSPSASSQPGGRSNAMTWKDASGQFWVFSGTGAVNDMWKFSTASLQWTWISGATSTTSPIAGDYGNGQPGAIGTPGQRNSGATWIDASGKLWMYGGFGMDTNGLTGYLNDLWSFDTTTNVWTFMGGGTGASSLAAACNWGVQGTGSTQNQPSPRIPAASWTDSATGNFYMFGGQGYLNSNPAPNCAGTNTAGLQNDFWEYNPTSNEWTWLGGVQTLSATGIYGQLKVASATNMPGARQSATTWTDNFGVFWMFGGNGIDNSGKNGYLSDLWKYDPVANMWTWVNGAATIDTVGNYGTNDVLAATNQPGARTGGLGWVDNSGNLWLFGGYGINSTGSLVELNDLWEYQASSGQWVWINGSYNGSVSGYYGTITVLGNGNMPGSRYGAAGWKDSSGNFWMYGGDGYDAVGANGHLSDVWKFLP